jgi:DNA (cytosine-5)-methyltransferase 1
MKKTYNVVDMFCGAGGETTGIIQAAEELQEEEEQAVKVNLFAINHWERAIETHAANHPAAEHLCQSVEHLDPVKVIPGQKLDLLWASPECTHHSLARGGRPRSEQSRASAWLVLKWLSELYVERVIIENVVEFLSWGPLDAKGKPIKSQKGKIFRAFIASIQSLGYTVDWRILCAADYGDPTSRRRLLIQAVKGKKRIVWPEITHIDGDTNLMGDQSWRPARDIIDWSIPGNSIFNRKKPLADKTLKRIASGIEKYWKDYAKPFLTILYGMSDVRSLDLPLPTITGSGSHHALVEPFITRYQGSHNGRHDGESRNHVIEHPLPCVDTSNRYGLVEPFFIDYNGNGTSTPINKPLRTITTKDRFALLEPFVFNIGHSSSGNRIRSIDEPISTIVTKAEHCLVEPGMHFDIRFRMLKNHELKRAHSFPDDYVLKGNTTEQTRQIGKAFPVKTAKALAKSVMN